MVRTKYLLVAFISLSLCGFTMLGSPPSDPFFLPEVGGSGLGNSSASFNGNNSFHDTGSKTLRANQSASAYSGCPVLVSAGQSNETGEAPTSYTPTNAANIHNFNPFDGALYAAADPLLGATIYLSNGTVGSGSYFGRFADALINAGPVTCVVMVPLGVAGTSVANWAPGGVLYPRIKNAIARLNARGFTSQYVLWGQGEQDCNIGTSQAAYVASANALFSDLPASVQKVFVAEQSYFNGAACAAVQSAQTAASPSGLINHAAAPPIWAGPNNDSLTGSICSGSAACRVSDNTHFSDAGNITRAANWQTVLHASGSPF